VEMDLRQEQVIQAQAVVVLVVPELVEMHLE
jgi:hypothetical protein